MNKKLMLCTIIGIIFVSISGTLLHFVYQLSGENYFAGLFSPVSESTWEHMKLIFFPMLFYSIIISRPLKSKYPCISTALSAGLIAGTILIPVIFYTYSGILGFNMLCLDIATFYISVIAAFIIVYKISVKCSAAKYTVLLEFIIFIMISAFIIFSYNPPQAGIFKSPVLPESNQAENRIVNYVKELCVNVFGNQKHTGIFDNFFNS